MKSTKNVYGIHRLFITLMATCLLFGVIFFITNNLDFLINAITYGKASLPNLAYWFAKFIGTMIIPLVFLIPSGTHFERIKVIKYTFIVYGVLHILTLSWIFPYFAAHGINGFFSNEAITAFQSATENSFVASHVFWDTYSWAGNIFSLLFGIFCVYVGLNFDDDKKKVCDLVISLFAAKLFVPIILNLFSANGFLSAFWITNNYADIICLGIFAAAVVVAATFDSSWISLIWDQEVPQNEE